MLSGEGKHETKEINIDGRLLFDILTPLTCKRVVAGFWKGLGSPNPTP